MTSEISAPPSDPTRQDKKSLAIAVFVLLLGVNLFLLGESLFGVALCFVGLYDPNISSRGSIWTCVALFYGLAVLMLPIVGCGAFLMLRRRRYGLALTLMAIPALLITIMLVVRG